MKWHEEAMPKDCQKALEKLSSATSIRDFYLAGGTALALRLGHRISVDLDFFSGKNSLDEPSRAGVQEEIAELGRVGIDEQKDRTMHLRFGRTHISFFYYTPPLLARCDRWNGVQVASALDIGAMKLSALVGRGSRKDFLDLYILTTRVISLEYLLGKAQKKFRSATDFTAQSLRALVYFKDAETEDPPAMLESISWRAVKAHFEREVRRLSRSFI